MGEKSRVLITVMTYPTPSTKMRETVCTAGITEDGSWVRLYPIDYRYLPPERRFHKFQWVEVELAQRGASNDNRRESRRPDLNSLTPGERLEGWSAKRAYVDKCKVHTLNELKALYDEDTTSLGVVKPTKIIDLKIEPQSAEWDTTQQASLAQLGFFETPTKPLKKMPFKFTYVFECSDSKKPHNAMCEDWELGVLYLKEERRLGDPKKAAESVKKKFLGELCAPERDTHFFMGTVFPYNTWVVVGVFWPPKRLQRELL